MNMKNWKVNNLIFVFLVILLGCKNEPARKNVEIPMQSVFFEKPSLTLNDTISINITNSYDLDIVKDNNVLKKINFFEPIKDRLENEEVYAQILYEKKNIIINLEIGENADIYEDIYLSKKRTFTYRKNS